MTVFEYLSIAGAILGLIATSLSIWSLARQINAKPNLKAAVESAYIERLTASGWSNGAIRIMLILWNEGKVPAHITNLKMISEGKEIYPLDSKITLERIFAERYQNHDLLPRVAPIFGVEPGEIVRRKFRFLFPELVFLEPTEIIVYRHKQPPLRLALNNPLQVKEKRFTPGQEHLLDT